MERSDSNLVPVDQRIAEKTKEIEDLIKQTETDIDLTGLRIVNPGTGNEVRLQQVVDEIKKVNE